MLTHLLIGIAAAIGWALLVLASPVARCRRCHGRQITRTPLAKRIRKCRRCKGTGRAYRFGAVLVHRLLWTIAGEPVRARLLRHRDRTEVPK